MRFLILILSALLVSGCATSGKDHYANTKLYKTHPDRVVLTEGDITDKPYKVIRDLEVKDSKATIFHDDPTKESVNLMLKEHGAKLGADAIILVRHGTVGIGIWSWGEMEGRGRAVKFID